jgi:cysteine-rich repeat protein
MRWGPIACGLAVAGLAATMPAAVARALTVELNLLYVHGVQTCAASRTTAQNALADVDSAVAAALPARIAAFEAAHPGVHVVVHSGRANLYTATPSGIHPSDSPDPLDMDDWEVGDPGCTTTQQGDPCTTAYEWRYRLVSEINRLFPAPASNIILIGHSSGARTAMEVSANVGPSGVVNTFDWGVRNRIAGVMTVHGMLDAINSSTYNFVGFTSFETGCKNGDLIAQIGGACAPGNGWCEYAGRVGGFPAADWVATNKRALMLTAWGSCSPSAWTGNSDGSLPYDAQGSPLAVGIDMTPAPGTTYRPSHGQFYGSFCHSAITNGSNAQHAAARDAATQRLLDWLFVAAPRVANSGSDSTPSIAYNQFSAVFPMGTSCPAGEIDDAITSGTKGLGIDVVGVCKHPGFFDGDDHPVAMSEITVTNGATCNGSYQWQQAHDSSNSHAATFWWKTRSLFADAPDLIGHLASQALARCGNGILEPGEACDDGNTAAGDCCSPTCEFETAGSACADDTNPCTNDVCNATGQCTHPANTATCDDGVFCNGADTCSGGTCSVHAGDPCAAGSECNRTCSEASRACAAAAGVPCSSDGNVCTTDQCNGAGACVHTPNNAPCDDLLFCNGADTCAGGTCSVHAGNPCVGGGECNASCSENPRTCAAPAGTACSSDGNVCTSDTCNGAGQCVHPPNAAPCDDGVFCNGADTCSGGTCSVHAGDPCAAGAACHRTCTEATHSCLSPAGSACADDGNGCTNDVCNGSGTCTHPPNTAPCDDGVFCNGADTCSGGSCVVHAGDPCAGGAECARTCREALHACADPAGTACSDEGDVCTDDRCNGSGACAHTPNTAACDDGNPCTIGDTCSGGTCVPGPEPDCGRCATCDPSLGCVQRPRTGCKHAAPGGVLRIRNATADTGDAVTWVWRRGEATLMSELGDPQAHDRYTLCLFDESGAAPALAFDAAVPGGAVCGVEWCWRSTKRAMTYKNRDRSPEGVDTIRLLSGLDGRASVVVKGKGPLLSSRADGLPAPPLGLPLRVQLQSANSTCWESRYTQPDVNKPSLFKARSD